MYLKKIYFISVFLFFTKTIFAQTPNFTVGPELQGANRPISINLHDNELSFFAGDFASGAMGKKDLNFFRIDKNTHTPTLNKTNLTQLKYANYTLERIYSFPESELVLYSSDHINDNIILNYQVLDNGSKGPFEMISLNMGKKIYPKDKPVKSFFGYNTYEGLYNNYHLWLSPNKEKFLYIDNIPLVNHQNPDRVPEARLVLMNTKDMKVEKELAFDLGILNFGNGVLFGDNNFAYSLVKVNQDKENAKNFHYTILGLSLKDGVPSFEHEIKFPGKTIKTIQYDIAKNGDILCGGAYAEFDGKRSSKYVDGIFYVRINPETGSVIAENMSPLDAKTVAFLGGTINGNIVEGVSDELDVKTFLEFENGTVNLIFENRLSDASGNYYRAILISNFNTKGNLNWISTVPKYQFLDEGSDYHFCSFSSRVNGNALTMVFSDDKDNYDENTKQLLTENKTSIKKSKKTTIKSGAVGIASVNEKGELNQKLLAETPGYSCYSLGAEWNKAGDEIYFMTKKKSGKHCISKIKLN